MVKKPELELAVKINFDKSQKKIRETAVKNQPDYFNFETIIGRYEKSNNKIIIYERGLQYFIKRYGFKRDVLKKIVFLYFYNWNFLSEKLNNTYNYLLKQKPKFFKNINFQLIRIFLKDKNHLLLEKFKMLMIHQKDEISINIDKSFPI